MRKTCLISTVALLVFAIALSASTFAEEKNQSFPVTVTYDLTVEEAISAGNYDWSNSDINSKNFPSHQKGTASVVVKLVHFDRDMNLDEVLKELDTQGLRPATLAELLAFGATYPDQQRELRIVALGSTWRHHGLFHIGLLLGNANDRYLTLYWPEACCWAEYRIAAILKSN